MVEQRNLAANREGCRWGLCSSFLFFAAGFECSLSSLTVVASTFVLSTFCGKPPLSQEDTRPKFFILSPSLCHLTLLICPLPFLIALVFCTIFLILRRPSEDGGIYKISSFCSIRPDHGRPPAKTGLIQKHKNQRGQMSFWKTF